jgi:glucokinase
MDDRLIGVDVGGTKVSVAVLDRGELGEPHIEPTRLDSADALLDQIVGAVQRAGDGEPYAAVGLGMPSVIDWETGRVRSSVNIPLKDVAVRAVLRERLDVPVYVDNDASVAALAEATVCDVRNLVMLTIGTGVGGGVVIDGRVFRGTTGAAPELGHMVVGARLDEGEPQTRDRFPQPGTLEALAAGTALDALARERGCRDGREVVARAQEGDGPAREAITLLGHRLGVGIANVINIFDPEVVAIGGGVSAAGELLLAPARETARRFILPGVGSQTDIRLARSGAEAGVRGAALLAGQELELEVAT